MRPSSRRKWMRTWVAVSCLAAWTAVWSSSDCAATEIVLKDGRVLRGKLGKTSSLTESPLSAKAREGSASQMIVLLDDDLRRTFVSIRSVVQVRQEENRQADEKFVLRQRVMRAGQAVQSAGRLLRAEPFDEYGRRTLTMAASKGPTPVVQGITELTPRWAKVEGISHVWDMRIATSSIPSESLDKILWKQTDPKSAEGCKKIARFYLQSERYRDAEKVLKDLLASMPDRTDLKEQLEPSLRAIRQMSARQIARELRLRQEAGQHRMAWNYLAHFPTEGVAGEILQDVRERTQHYEVLRVRRDAVVQQLKTLTGRLKDTVAERNLRPILEEIAAEVSFDTLDRMAAFLQNADDAQTPDAEKIALAISGWLLGADAATQKLPTAISAYKVRRMIRDYLRGASATDRERIATYVQQESGGEPSLVAELLAHMKPPLDPPDAVAGKPGYYRLETPGLTKEAPIVYYVQLPPEYDPYRSYPTIVTLHGAFNSAERQIDWWAGICDKNGGRTGQAARHGYIVISPEWAAGKQKNYEYSASEHTAVLSALRDACRRFSVDTDRVYLSGHSTGGDAAWDIGLSHPDLWAGVIPIVAQSDRYCNFYRDNARYVPFYVVDGELDGGHMAKNAMDLDRYMRHGLNATVVEYRGRGYEDFHEEILKIFEWMQHFRRNFFPREFSCETMRSWDNFFWWVEIQGLPPRSQVDPEDWPPPAGSAPAQVKGSITPKNGVNVRAGAGRVVVWLSPKMIDFKQKTVILVNGRRINGSEPIIRPDIRVLLEDVRTRGDRQHPFWARLEGATGRSYDR